MPSIDIAEYAKLPPNDLEEIRNRLVKKAAGNHDNLDIEDLHELAAVTTVLRRRASGPPKAKAPSSRVKATKATIEDLL